MMPSPASRTSLHLPSLEKLRGASVNGFGWFPLTFSPLLSAELREVTFTGASRGRFYFGPLAPGQHSGLAVKEPLPCVSPRVLFLFLCSAPPLVSITQSSSPAQTFHSQSLQSLAQIQLIYFFSFSFLF